MTLAMFTPEWEKERCTTFLTHCLRIATLNPANAIEIAQQHERIDPWTLTGLTDRVKAAIAKKVAA